jgi:peptide/nickel transport system substrate-binding protein
LLAQPEFGLVRASVGTGPFEQASPEEAAALFGKDETKGSLLLTHRIRIPDAEDPVEKVRLTGGNAGPLISDFAKGEIDLVLGGTVADLPIAMQAKVPRGALRFDPVAGLFGLIPTKRSAALQEVEVRRLLNRAIDRQALVKGLNVEGLVPRATLLQAGLEGVAQLRQPDWLTQPIGERRAELVSEAQRLFGNAGRPTIRLSIPQGPGGDYLFGRLRYDWAYLGIDVERAPSPASADFVWIDEVAPSASPAWFVRRFRCNLVDVCLEDAEPLMADARKTLDAVERARLLIEAARQMEEAQLFMPIAAPIRWSLVSGRVPGFVENPFARHTLVGLADPRLGERS